MTVFVEYVLINNFFIDYMLLKAAFSLTGATPNKWGLMVSCAFGAVVALVYPLLSALQALVTVIKILSGLLIVLIPVKYKNFREYFINSAVFFCYTFLVGGVLMGVFNIFDLDYSLEPYAALMCVPVYFALKIFGLVIRFVYNRRTVVQSVVDISISLNGKSVKCKGFFDTGNGLYHKNSPVIVCSKEFITKNFGECLHALKFEKISVKTINGESQNLSVKVDRLLIYLKDELNTFNIVTLMISKYGVGEGYDIILHPALNKESSDENKVHSTVKKVS